MSTQPDPISVLDRHFFNQIKNQTAIMQKEYTVGVVEIHFPQDSHKPESHIYNLEVLKYCNTNLFSDSFRNATKAVSFRLYIILHLRNIELVEAFTNDNLSY